VSKYSINDKVSHLSIDYLVLQSIVYPYRGVWSFGSSYSTGDVVKVSGFYYTAQKGITTSLTSPTIDTSSWAPTPTPDADTRFEVAPTAWPMYTSILDLATFNLTDVPGFYNSAQFSWLRGAKTLIDDGSKWAVVGEVSRAVGITTSNASYVSQFDMPPVVKLTPSNTPASPYPLLRGTSLLLDASGTNDADNDQIVYTWTARVSSP
jgi:hypothetical protein